MRLSVIPSKRLRVSPVILWLAIAFLLCLCVFSPAQAAKKHRQNQPSQKPAHGHASATAHQRANAVHLARLAAQEKSAWRAHLAKLRTLPHHEKIAMKRHDRRFKRAEDQAHLARAAEQQAHKTRLAKQQARAGHVAQISRAKAGHLARLAQRRAKVQHLAAIDAARRMHAKHDAAAAATGKALQVHFARVQALQAKHQAQLSARDTRTARLQAAHLERLTAHQQTVAQHVNARQQIIARRTAAHQQAIAQRTVAHQQAIARRALAHQARLAKIQSAHSAHLAAQRAHEIALHGDGSGGHSIHFWQTVAAGVPVKVITVDLNDQDVKVSAVMSRHGSGTAEPFRQMISRANPNVAVTGTFFSLDNLQPVGDIVIDGSLVHFGGMGTALCITPSNRADMVTCEWGRHHNWSGYDFVCACGPRLLRRGRVVLDPASERFRDRHMLAPNSRIAVGITSGNKIVFAMTHEPIYLGRLAKVMRAIGTTDAMNLDAGTSTGFYYNGATLARPGRQLTNMIVVYGQKQRYQRALDQLVPASYRRSDMRSAARRQVSEMVR